MSFNPQEKQQSNFVQTLPKEGMRRARVARIIELGDQETPFGVKSQVQFGFGLLADFVEIDGEQKQQMIFPHKMTISNNEKAKLMEYVEALQPDCTDLGDLIGKACMLNVKNKQVGDRTYSNVLSITPPIEDMEYPELDMDTYYFDFENPSLEVWEKLTNKRKEQIKGALNFQGSALEELVG